MENKIEGRNPVIEALRFGRPIDKILVQNGEKHGSVIKIIAMAKEKGYVKTMYGRKRPIYEINASCSIPSSY